MTCITGKRKLDLPLQSVRRDSILRPAAWFYHNDFVSLSSLGPHLGKGSPRWLVSSYSSSWKKTHWSLWHPHGWCCTHGECVRSESGGDGGILTEGWMTPCWCSPTLLWSWLTSHQQELHQVHHNVHQTVCIVESVTRGLVEAFH